MIEPFFLNLFAKIEFKKYKMFRLILFALLLFAKCRNNIPTILLFVSQ